MYSTSLTLLDRVRESNDQAAWDRFVRLYTPFLFRCCCRAGLNADDSADIVQDVFVQLLRELPKFQYAQDGSFRGWLRTVTVNKCRERFRRRTEIAVGGSSPPIDDVAEDHDSDALWGDEYRTWLVGRALRIMQMDFEPGTWQACWSTIVEGRPATVVAAELGISVNGVYVARSRVLRRLRAELGSLLED